MSCLTLIVKRDCPLCDEATAFLTSIGHEFTIAHDEDRVVPVVEMDGRVIAQGRVEPRAIRAALARVSGG